MPLINPFQILSQGLAEIDLGNSLIKEAVNQLKHDLPNIRTFVSLSPVPGFCKWLDHKLMETSESSVISWIMGKSLEDTGFPLGEFVRANKQKANVIGW